MADAKMDGCPANVNDLTGQKFGRLTVTGYSHKHGRNHKWRCRCKCGKETVKRADHLKSGRSRSCGCLNAEVQSKNFTKHGGAAFDKSRRHPLYSIWSGMKKRCYSESCAAYPYYGGRGIGVCPEWREDFAQFAEDMGERPVGTSLDRIDNDADYGPKNCRWATKSEQMKNRRPFKRGCRNERTPPHGS